MKKKKTDQANLEKKRPLNFFIGAVITLSLILISFEWSSNPSKSEITNMVNEIEFEEQMVITRREEPKPKEEIKQPEVLEVLEIVEDDIEVEDFDFDFEVDENTEYDFIITEDEEEIIEEDVPFIIVSNMPKFQGGDLNTFWKWCQDHAIYPEIAAENGVSGVVNIQFIINKQGYVDNIKILRGVDPALDQEAIRVVKSSPRWTPGDQRGKPASVLMSLPIRFILQ